MKINKTFNLILACALISLATSVFAITNSISSNINQVEAFSGSQTPNYSSTYYDSCDGLSGDQLLDELGSFNNPRSKSYDWGRYEDADEAQGYNNKVICLYTRELFDKSAHVGSYSSTTWNREHIFTQTKFPNSDTDNHNIFACEGKINGIRSNKKFGEVTHNSSTQVETYGVARDCYTNSTYFEPCDEAKGEVARAAMYCCVYYDYKITDIFDSVDTCLQWHNQFGVTDRDIYRNNAVYENQGNRNPFVDHPEYANLIWGDAEPAIILPTNLNLTVGEQYTLNGYLNVNNSVNISYTSSNSSIVSVSGNVLTANSVGNTSINASCYYGDEQLTASMDVTVNDVIEVTNIAISPSSLNLKVNQTSQLSIIVEPSNASNNVNYVSSNPNVASVSTDGIVKALASGTTTITASSVLFPNISDSIEVNVSSLSAESGTFVKVESQLDDYNGKYLLVYEKSNTEGIVFNPGSENINGSGNLVNLSIDNYVISDSDAINFAVDVVGTTNNYDISYNGETFVFNSDNDKNQIEISTQSPSAKHSFTYQSNETIIKCENTYFRFNSDWNGFRYYKQSSYSNLDEVQLYKFVEETTPDIPEETYNAQDFANDFLTLLVCDPTGVNPPSVDVWNELMSKYDTLSEEDKNLLRTYSSELNDTIGTCLARYDYIINKYSESIYPDFLNRGSVDNAAQIIPVDENDYLVLIIVMLSLSIISGIIISVVIIAINKNKKSKNISKF